MEIRQVLTFKKVVELGNLTAAAAQLGYAQPTVSLHIQMLEEELGVPLFDRIGKKLMLTDAGRELYECSQDMSQIIRKIESIGVDKGGPRASVRLAMPPAILKYLMFDILADLVRDVPQADFHITNDHNYQVIYKQLLNGTVDFAILNGQWFSSSTIKIEKLHDYDQVLIASSDFDISGINLTVPGKPLGARMIYNHPLSASKQEFENYLNKMDINPDAFLEVWNIEAIKESVRRGLGIALVPEFVVRDELAEGALKKVQTDVVFSKYSVNLAYLKSKWEAPYVKLFRTYALSKFKSLV